MSATAAVAGEARERLLDAAALLFARSGYAAVSIRDIAAEAGVNSASIAYYFGGKEGLLAAAYRRVCIPIVEARLRRLEAARARHDYSLEAALEAFIRPSLTAADEGGDTPYRLRSVLVAEQSRLLDSLVAEVFDPGIAVFVEAFHAFLPALTREDVLWRFHFLVGALTYGAAGVHRIRALSGGRCDPRDAAALTRELVVFAAAGLRAPPG
jgi:AcrR family transcriptional regulator